MAIPAEYRPRPRPLSLNGLRESRAQLVLCNPDAHQKTPTVDPEDFTQSCCAFWVKKISVLSQFRHSRTCCQPCCQSGL